MKTICIYPKIKKDNFYMRNLVNILKRNYNVIEFSDCLKRPYLFFRIDIFHFNWIENVHYKNNILIHFEVIIKYLFIYICKIFRKKIVWTFHNKQPHDKKIYNATERFMRFLMKQSDTILIHCKETNDYIDEKFKKKVIYVPHGNYIGNYKDDNKNLRNDLNIKEDELVFLFLGQIRAYKNIELLIKSFEEAKLKKSKLLIAGACPDHEYEKHLNEITNDKKNIIYKLGFIDDEYLISYLNTANIVVLPYNIESSLNSGSIILAFSYKKTVISSYIGTLKDIDKDFYYSYSYKNYDESKRKLIDNMQKVYKEFSKDSNILKTKGQEAYEYVKKNNSWEELYKKINYIYG